MKNILLLLLLYIVCGKVNAQSNDDQASIYKVTNYTFNGENLDHIALENDVALAFLKDEDGYNCFANLWRDSDSYSYGRIYSFKKLFSNEETNKKHRSDEYLFSWKYQNSYDNDTGEASVRFTRVFIGSLVKFQCEIIIIKDNSTLLLKGYLEK